MTAAIVSLKGLPHGGVNVDAGRILEEINRVGSAEKWVDSQSTAGRRIPGFGHRIYKRGTV